MHSFFKYLFTTETSLQVQTLAMLLQPNLVKSYQNAKKKKLRCHLKRKCLLSKGKASSFTNFLYCGSIDEAINFKVINVNLMRSHIWQSPKSL